MKSQTNSWITRIGIVVIAAIVVEIISVIQYQRVRSMLGEEMDLRTHVVMITMAHEIEHVLELAETTMAGNEWDRLSGGW